MEEEPASKKIKLEVVEVYLPEEETEADLELDSSVFIFSTIIKVCDLGGTPGHWYHSCSCSLVFVTGWGLQSPVCE